MGGAADVVVVRPCVTGGDPESDSDGDGCRNIPSRVPVHVASLCCATIKTTWQAQLWFHSNRATHDGKTFNARK